MERSVSDPGTGRQLPLAVDLDSSLVYTDTLLELLLSALKQHPSILWKLPVWLSRGRAYCKQQLAHQAQLKIDLIPFNPAIVDFLRAEQAGGRELILITASDQAVATAVAQHLGIFRVAIGSDGHTNVSGTGKAKKLVERYGAKHFAYLGNAWVDLPVWTQAQEAYVVSGSKSLISAAKKVTDVVRVFAPPRATFTQWTKVVRVHQWVKNILIFVPLITAHLVTDMSEIKQAVFAFIAFCAASSSVYILNDLFDLEADRQHPHKKNRPFAAGQVPIIWGMVLVPILVVISLLLSWWLSAQFFALVALYLVLTLLYSWHVKRQILVDVFLLAILYTLRIYAGAAAMAISVSSWLTAFALFFFLSLAIIKRFTELQRLKGEQTEQAAGRGYRVKDSVPLSQFGIASAFAAVIILALYITSEEITLLYSSPEILWLLVPLLLYWLSRMWFLAFRGRIDEDPLIWATHDEVSYLVGIISLSIVVSATILAL